MASTANMAVNFTEELRAKYQIQNSFGNNLRVSYGQPSSETTLGGGLGTYPLTAGNLVGLSPMVKNAPPEEDGSRKIPQFVDSGFGRKGFSTLSYIG